MTPHLDEILAELRKARGVDLRGYRRDMLTRRLTFRMDRIGCERTSAYLDRLRTDPSECDRLIGAIAIKVSLFFRNPIVWELIAQSVLPAIIERKRRAGSKEIRAWSAGCAEGEEAYSLAILVHRALKDDANDWTTHIFATDINGDALEVAQSGVYPRERFESTQLGVLDRYFIGQDHGYEVKPFIRETVRFSRDDLTSTERVAPVDSIFGSFDIVLCRNVIIYFSDELQGRVVEKIARTLAMDGYLILGDSESLVGEVRPAFRAVSRRNRIYQVRMRPGNPT